MTPGTTRSNKPPATIKPRKTATQRTGQKSFTPIRYDSLALGLAWFKERKEETMTAVEKTRTTKMAAAMMSKMMINVATCPAMDGPKTLPSGMKLEPTMATTTSATSGAVKTSQARKSWA